MNESTSVVPAPRLKFFQPKATHKKPPKTLVAVGIRMGRNGSLEARINIGERMHQRIFPPGTELATAQMWREHTKAAHAARAHRIARHERPLPASIDGWCYLYFVQQGTSIKIGRASDVNRRLEELQTASPGPLQLLVAVAAHCSLEGEFLKRFEPYRLNGEWFIYGPEIAKVVRRLQSGENPVEMLFNW